MGKIRAHSRIVLIVIIIIQFAIIGYFFHTNNYSTVTTGTDIVAIASNAGKRYLLIHHIDEPTVFELPEKVSYVNRNHNNVYLFDDQKNYVSTYYFNTQLSEYTIFYEDGIEYQETEFKCEREMCMLKTYNPATDNSEVQVFSAKDDQYIYLDAATKY